MKLLCDSACNSKPWEGKEINQCDFIIPVLNWKNHLIGMIRCANDKKIELWKKVELPAFFDWLGGSETYPHGSIRVGVFCSRHFFEMMRLREEKRSIRYKQHGTNC